MKETDVRQGTLALMVLKTLDVLGPLHGYGIARRIEQISGDLLTVNQGTLYPVLLKLEQEGSIASEWGASENNRKARFYQAHTAGAQATAGRNPELGADRGDHRTIFYRESSGPEMKALRRFFQRLTSWTTSARDEEILRAEIEDHIAMQTADNLRAGLIAHRSPTAGAAEVRQRGCHQGNAIGIREDSRLWKRCCAICAMRYAACEGPPRLRPPFS